MGAPAVLIALVAALLALPAGPAAGQPAAGPQVAILGVGLIDGHLLRLDLATAGLEAPGAAAPEPPTVSLAVWLDGVPAQATLPLIHMPPRFAMDLDLPAGCVRVGGVAVGTFAPVPRFRENLRFPVDVTVRRGPLAATARRTVTLLLPTVIVPGYLNETGGVDTGALDAFVRRGYTSAGPAPTVFWFTYPSLQVTLEDGARALAAYVRQVVLPATYAARINVVGYSVGGLMARWNLAYDFDGWGTLVDRLALVGVPNEGAVLAYLSGRMPAPLPFSGWGRSPLARTVVPTFPFWRPSAADPWRLPADGGSPLLAALNAQPLPPALRVYLFYGSHDPQRPAGPRTAAGLTGAAEVAYAPGDGIVLAASAQGLPVNGSSGVPALADRTVRRIDLGTVYHTQLLDAAVPRIADALQDRFLSSVDEAP